MPQEMPPEGWLSAVNGEGKGIKLYNIDPGMGIPTELVGQWDIGELVTIFEGLPDHAVEVYESGLSNWLMYVQSNLEGDDRGEPYRLALDKLTVDRPEDKSLRDYVLDALREGCA